VTNTGAAAKRPRPPGVLVDPDAVKRARQDAGLTLAQVANGEITRGAIHLIEAGRSNPSMKTLQLIARRTRRPVSFFLANPRQAGHRRFGSRAEAQVDELEGLAAAGHDRAVIDRGRQLLKEFQDVWAQAHIHYQLGQAHLRLSEAKPAGRHLQRARTQFEEIGDQWMVTECLDGQAGVLYLQENPKALSVAEEALLQCRQLKPVPIATEVRVLGHLGAIHVSRHEWKEAIARYLAAVEAAGVIRDLSRMARMYDDLSGAYQELGNLSKAAIYSHKALALHALDHDQSPTAITENNLGLILMRQGRLDAAEVHFGRSLALCEEHQLERGKAHVLLSLGELHLVRRQADKAERFCAEARTLSERLGERMTLGVAHQFLGKVAAIKGDTRRADAEFAAALSVLNELKVPQRLADCHASYARLLEERGETRRALEQWKNVVAVSRPDLVQADELDSYVVGEAR
jgi:tetratricopeptide (TPR) repeat protein